MSEKDIEELKQQIDTAVSDKDFAKTDQLNKELEAEVGYCIDYDFYKNFN